MATLTPQQRMDRKARVKRDAELAYQSVSGNPANKLDSWAY